MTKDAMDEQRKPPLRIGVRDRSTRLFGLGLLGVSVLIFGDHPGLTAIFAVVSLWLVARRPRLTVDFSQGRLIVPCGFWGWSSRLVPFAELTTVRVVRNGAKLATVSVVGSTGEFTANQSTYAVAAAQGSRVATLLKLRFTDGDRQREAGFVDEPLRARLLRTGTTPGDAVVEHQSPFRDAHTVLKAPLPPDGAQVRVTDVDDGLQVDAPESWGWRASTWAALLTTVALSLVLAELNVAQAQNTCVPAIIALVTSIAALVYLVADQRGFRLRVDEEQLTIHHFGKLWTSLPLDRISDLLVRDLRDRRPFYNGRSGASIVVDMIDGQRRSFGLGHTRQDLEWLAARIKHFVATH